MIGYDEPLSRPLNLYMERGEKIAMVGANGIGKTTLLKSILGLIPAVSGKVTLGDYLSIGYFEQEMRRAIRRPASMRSGKNFRPTPSTRCVPHWQNAV